MAFNFIIVLVDPTVCNIFVFSVCIYLVSINLNLNLVSINLNFRANKMQRLAALWNSRERIKNESFQTDLRLPESVLSEL